MVLDPVAHSVFSKEAINGIATLLDAQQGLNQQKVDIYLASGTANTVAEAEQINSLSRVIENGRALP